MDQRTEKEKLEEYLGVAVPEKAQYFRIIDNAAHDSVLYDLLGEIDTKYVTPQVARLNDSDPAIPNYRAVFNLSDAMKYHDNQWHEFMYGCNNWKGGMYLFEFRPDVIAVPEKAVDEWADELELGWMIPYSPEKHNYAAKCVGKVFVSELLFRGISKDGRASIAKTVYYVEVFEGCKVIATIDAEIEEGYYRFEEIPGGINCLDAPTFTKITKEEYLGAKGVAADMLSYSNPASDVELTERQMADRYLDIVAQNDRSEIEILDGAQFDKYPLIHISKDDIPKFTPFVSARTLDVSEENRTMPRVCVTPYVSNSLTGKGTLRGDYGHRHGGEPWPVMKLYGLRGEFVFKPSAKLCADAPATDELWLMSYSAKTQHYVGDIQGDFFPTELTFEPDASSDTPLIKKIEWLVNVLPSKQIMWCPDCPLESGYYHITEERSVTDGKHHTKFIKRIVTADVYIAAKEKLVNPPKRETPPSAGW